VKHCDIAAILARHAAATPGPMVEVHGSVFPSLEIQETLARDNLSPEVLVCYGKNEQSHANAVFAAAAWEDVPDLAAENVALRAGLREAIRLLDSENYSTAHLRDIIPPDEG